MQQQEKPAGGLIGRRPRRWRLSIIVLSIFSLCGAGLYQIHRYFFSSPDYSEHSDRVTAEATELKSLMSNKEQLKGAPVRTEWLTQIKCHFSKLKALVVDNHFQMNQVQIVEKLWRSYPSAQAPINELRKQIDVLIFHEAKLKDMKISLALFAKVVDMRL